MSTDLSGRSRRVETRSSGLGEAMRGLPILDIAGLTKSYGSGESLRPAVEEVSFSVGQREFVSIVGPSGAGKTTLLKCVAGLLSQTAGEVLFEGEAVTEPPKRLALVFQDYSRSLFPWLSVASNVALPLKGKGIEKARREEKVATTLLAVGLPDVGRSFPWQLSGGMQQRVALARALAYEPDCLLMDEPFASVDAQTRFDLEDLILRLRSQFGVTILFVTHDIDEAVYLSDRVVVLTRSPCRVKRVLDIELGEQRDQVETKSDRRFAHLRTEILGLVRADPPHAQEAATRGGSITERT